MMMMMMPPACPHTPAGGTEELAAPVPWPGTSHDTANSNVQRRSVAGALLDAPPEPLDGGQQSSHCCVSSKESSAHPATPQLPAGDSDVHGATHPIAPLSCSSCLTGFCCPTPLVNWELGPSGDGRPPWLLVEQFARQPTRTWHLRTLLVNLTVRHTKQ
jgi:hypothetical protein